jgi:hypothetical protein
MHFIQHCFICRPRVGGCWERTQDSCDFGIGCQTLKPLGYISSMSVVEFITSISVIFKSTELEVPVLTCNKKYTVMAKFIARNQFSGEILNYESGSLNSS